jgi:uncharacterized protein YbbC (DUF1343 family)
VRQALEQGADILELEQSWQKGLDSFEKLRRDVLLYN